MIEFIAGGARSGKSVYALAAAEACEGNLVFVATAVGGDDEMAERIARHQAERSEKWRLIEEPYQLSKRVSEFKPEDVVLIDCLTIWLSNWLCSTNVGQWEEEKADFLAALEKTRATIFLVTNEVGLGVIPIGSLSRAFVDQSGWLHQAVARIADRVTMVTFGIPTHLKK